MIGYVGLDLLNCVLNGVAANSRVDVVNGASVTEAYLVVGGVIPSAGYDGLILIDVVNLVLILVCKVLNNESRPRRHIGGEVGLEGVVPALGDGVTEEDDGDVLALFELADNVLEGLGLVGNYDGGGGIVLVGDLELILGKGVAGPAMVIASSPLAL